MPAAPSRPRLPTQQAMLPLFVVGALFAALVLFFGAAAYLLEFVLRREKEADLEQRLADVGATLLLAAEEARPGLFQLFAEAYAPAFAAHLGDQALLPLVSAADLAAARTEWENLLRRLPSDAGLRSCSLITEEGFVIASGGDDQSLAAGTRPLLLEIDRPEIERALATGAATATISYDVDAIPHKRVYLPLTAPLLGAVPAPAAGGAAVLPLLLRLEAPASYFAALDGLRQRVFAWLAIAALLLLAVAGVTLALMRRLERTTRQLAREDRLRSLGTLASGLAHELRNPLGIMRLSTEELAEELERTRGAMHLAPIAREALGEIDRLARLIRDVLSFARGETVSGEGTCAVRPVVHSGVTWLRKAVPQGWEVASNHEEGAWARVEVRIGEDALRQILLNLLRNAMDALSAAVEQGGAAGGTGAPGAPGETSASGAVRRHAPAIRVRLELADGGGRGRTLRLHVSDNGPGVPRALRQSIFEPFFTQRAEGTGLGLPISRRLAESVGGSLRLEPSDELRGAHFVLTLPVVGEGGGAGPLAP